MTSDAGGTGGEEARLVRDTASDLFADFCDPEAVDAAAAAGWDGALWAALEDVGLTLVSVEESAGGSGGTLFEAGALLGAAGEFAAPVPLAETALLGGWLLATAGLPVPAGPLTAVAAGVGDLVVETSAAGDAVTARGRLARVPWARVAGRVVVLARADGGDARVLVLDPTACTLVPGTNVAGEPRDDLVVDVTLPAGSVTQVPAATAKQFVLRAALARTVLIAGAAERALALTLRYVTERVQFGRPISRFQAVQHQVAELAGEVAAIRTAADAAVGVCVAPGLDSQDAAFAVAAAKATASRSAGTVARIAHQLHGAIGFTHEHSLRLATTRLWAWRDEAGNEAYWYDQLGADALAAGADGAWPLVTAAS